MGLSPALEARGLRRRYGPRDVVDDVSLAVRAGEVVAILGPNGAGKSTLFRMLLLLEPSDAGEILLDGRAVRPGDAAARRQLAGVFQRPWLFRGSALENVTFGLRAAGVERTARRARARAALDDVGLGALADMPAHRLSGGEAQRVALARALVLKPAILLLDEPTAGLDVTARRRFREDLERLVRSGAGAALVITHDPADAFALADRIAVMEAGRLTQVATPAELVATPVSPFVATFTGAELLLDGRVIDVEDRVATVRLASGAHVRAMLPEDGDIRAADAVHVAYRPEDVTLSVGESAERTSASNRLACRVTQLLPGGGLVRVRLDGEAALTALITRQSAEALGLVRDTPVHAVLKATALHVFRS